MAVFYINFMEHNGKLWKLLENGYIHLFDGDRCIELFIGFPDELIDHPVLVHEYRRRDGNKNGAQCKAEVKKYPAK